jgi:hypothetical protein
VKAAGLEPLEEKKKDEEKNISSVRIKFELIFDNQKI